MKKTDNTNEFLESQKKIEEILEHVLQISKDSYKQETDRSGIILSKSDNLFKYSSTIFTATNVIFSLLYVNKLIDSYALLAGYSIVILPFIVSIFFAISAQHLRHELFFPFGSDIINAIVKSPADYDSTIKMKNYHILCYSESTEKMQQNNNYKAVLLSRAYWFYMLGVGCFTGLFIYLASIAINGN